MVARWNSKVRPANDQATRSRLMGDILRLTPYALRLTPYASRLTPHALRLTPHALRLAPCALRLTPRSRREDDATQLGGRVYHAPNNCGLTQRPRPSREIIMRRMFRFACLRLPFTVAVLVLFGVLAAVSTPSGQERRPEGLRPLTPADYARAERQLAAAVNPLVIGGQVSANWLAGDSFWYRYQVPDGYEFMLVDPTARTRQPAFDHARLAAALSTAAKGDYTAHTLPFRAFAFSA